MFNSLAEIDIPEAEAAPAMLPVSAVLPRHQAHATLLLASIHARTSPPPLADERALILHDDRLCRALRHLRDALDILRESDRQTVAAGPDPY